MSRVLCERDCNPVPSMGLLYGLVPVQRSAVVVEMLVMGKSF